MKYYLDTEFYEDGMRIHPISLAIVREDYKELYMEFKVTVPLDPWLEENVVPHLIKSDAEKVTSAEAAELIKEFVGDDEEPEFWAYYADYDWVLFAMLFGRMIDLPENFPKYCMDLKQLWVHLGRPEKQRVNPPNPVEHFALADAKWNLEFHKNLLRWRDSPL